MKYFLIAMLFATALFAQNPVDALVESGDSISAAIMVGGDRVVGIEVSDDFNGDSIFVKTSSSYSGTYKVIKNEAGAVVSAIACSAGDLIRFNRDNFYLIRKYIKIEHNDPTDSDQTSKIFLGSYD